MKDELYSPTLALAETKATLLHINIRKEGEDEILAADLKVSVVVDREILSCFARDETVGSLADALWLPDEAGTPRYPELSEFKLCNIFKDHELIIDEINLRFRGVKVKKFVARPLDGFLLGMGFSVAIYPSPQEIGRLADFLDEELRIRIAPPMQLDLSGSNVTSISDG